MENESQRKFAAKKTICLAGSRDSTESQRPLQSPAYRSNPRITLCFETARQNNLAQPEPASENLPEHRGRVVDLEVKWVSSYSVISSKNDNKTRF
jgi:hypothetical protein